MSSVRVGSALSGTRFGTRSLEFCLRRIASLTAPTSKMSVPSLMQLWSAGPRNGHALLLYAVAVG
jgi:hypothetical protein